MSSKTEPQISPKVLSSLFARFTADRDVLLTAVERCEQRLVDLSVTTAEAKADQALALAQEALELAREAMKAARQRRS
jgi:hypothetical protein